MYTYMYLLLQTQSALMNGYSLLSTFCPLCLFVIVTLMITGRSDWIERKLSRLPFTLIFFFFWFLRSVIYEPRIWLLRSYLPRKKNILSKSSQYNALSEQKDLRIIHYIHVPSNCIILVGPHYIMQYRSSTYTLFLFIPPSYISHIFTQTANNEHTGIQTPTLPSSTFAYSTPFNHHARNDESHPRAPVCRTCLFKLSTSVRAAHS